MVFAMSTACFFPATYTEDAISLISKLGVRHIEVFFSCFGEYKKSFVNELKVKAQDAGVAVVSVHAYSLSFEPQLFSRHERSRQEALDTFKQVLEAGAALGSGIYVFHGPVHVKRSQSLILDFAYIAQHIQPLAELAKSYGIRLAWENVHYCWYAQPDFPEKLLPLLDTDNLLFTLDIKQAAQAGYDPESFAEHAAERLANIHICDYVCDPCAGVLPRLPFHGCMDFAKLKAALNKLCYDGPMVFEVYANNYKSHAELMQSYHKVKSFFTDGMSH